MMRPEGRPEEVDMIEIIALRQSEVRVAQMAMRRVVVI